LTKFLTTNEQVTMPPPSYCHRCI